jgi:hypothetical protein
LISNMVYLRWAYPYWNEQSGVHVQVDKICLLMQETPDHLLYPNPASHMVHDEHLQYFEFLGKILGKVFFLGVLCIVIYVLTVIELSILIQLYKSDDKCCVGYVWRHLGGHTLCDIFSEQIKEKVSRYACIYIYYIRLWVSFFMLLTNFSLLCQTQLPAWPAIFGSWAIPKLTVS